jgi:hypothetical protein
MGYLISKIGSFNLLIIFAIQNRLICITKNYSQRYGKGDGPCRQEFFTV